MEKELYARIDQWFDEHREAMIEDIKRIVRIPSVSNPSEEIKPFGKACRDAMDEMLAIGREHGFYTENYDYYVGSIGLEKKNLDNTIGFWNHLDVVPVGNDWVYEPFEPVCKEEFLIGRGSQDNKGPAIGMLYLMQCLRELEVPMKHELCLYVGCDEERGMSDLEYFTKNYPTPKLSMIADSGFPVCYGEKGIIEGQIVTQTVLGDCVIALDGGNASNMIPDRARIVLKAEEAVLAWAEQLNKKNDAIIVNKTADTVEITAIGTSRHSAFPEGSVNAIHELAINVMDAPCFSLEEKKVFEFLAYSTEEYYGEHTGIYYQDEVSGKTTCAGTVLFMKEGKAVLHFNIRYSITADSEQMEETLSSYAKEWNGIWELDRNSKPNYFPKEHPAVQLLTDFYNEQMGLETEAFVMGGGTYARKLPNAFAYGIGGMPETEDDKRRKELVFKPGHGGAHGPDEGLNLRQYFEAIKLYTKAIVAMNACEL